MNGGGSMTFPKPIADCFQKRAADSHKGTYGTLLTVCGSYGMAGAAVLCAKAAYRSGVGLCACATPKGIYPIVASAVPEAVFLPLDTDENGIDLSALTAIHRFQKRATAMVIGCGLGTGENTVLAVHTLLQQATVPVVLDADGINALSLHIPVRETGAPPLILTPHPAEMARLLGCSVEQVQQDRDAAAVKAASMLRAVVVLKGHRTVIADESGVFWHNESGNAGMATAGSGDVLAGMIGSFLAQGFSPRDAAVCGAYLHGAAGDLMAERLSQQALMASDLVDGLPPLFLQLEQ